VENDQKTSIVLKIAKEREVRKEKKGKTIGGCKIKKEKEMRKDREIRVERWREREMKGEREK
jgi:hypothetical protein